MDYNDFMEALHASCSELKIQPIDSFVAKVIQLYETTVVRHGLMLVGQAMGGKTCCYRSLQKTLTKLAHLERFEKVSRDPNKIPAG